MTKWQDARTFNRVEAVDEYYCYHCDKVQPLQQKMWCAICQVCRTVLLNVV